MILMCMKRIIDLLVLGIALLALGCEEEERLYDGPDIVYFDEQGILRDEIADNNTRMVFRIVSPKSVGHDREYAIVKRFGSTLEEGTDYTFPDGRTAVIKAGTWWTDVNIDINPESLSAKVDTITFGLEPHSGSVASFDSELRLIVSKRCEFVPSLYAGEYEHSTHLFDYMPDHTVTMEVVNAPDGSVIEDQLRIKAPYGESDILMKLDYSNPKKVTPVIEMQPGGTISTYDPWLNQVSATFYVHTTEQHTYPRVFTKCDNESYLYTCSGEFVIYMVGGVFFTSEDGEVYEGIIGSGAVEETFRRTELPYAQPAAMYSEAMNIEVQAEVIRNK